MKVVHHGHHRRIGDRASTPQLHQHVANRRRAVELLRTTTADDQRPGKITVATPAANTSVIPRIWVRLLKLEAK